MRGNIDSAFYFIKIYFIVLIKYKKMQSVLRIPGNSYIFCIWKMDVDAVMSLIAFWILHFVASEFVF